MKLLGQATAGHTHFPSLLPQVPLTLQEEGGVKISPEILKTENKQDSTDE